VAVPGSARGPRTFLVATACPVHQTVKGGLCPQGDPKQTASVPDS
jgi:hypothetical protein